MTRTPQIKFIGSIDRNVRATISTKRAHNYQSGDLLRVVIEKDYGCPVNETTLIEVIDDKTFITNIDTSNLPEFKNYVFDHRSLQVPPQCIPITLK